MNIHILTEGGRVSGFGHVARCSALYDAFCAKGARPNLIINGDNSISGLLSNRKYKILNWLNDKRVLSEVAKKRDSVVIVDSYSAGIGFYKKLSEEVDLPAYLDDYKRFDYPRGVIINGAIGAERIGYPARKDVRYLVGAKFAPLRKEFWDAPRKLIRKRIGKVMLIFGGNDKRNIMPKMLDCIKKDRTLEKEMVVGKASRNANYVKRLKGGMVKFTYDPSVPHLKRIMIESDLAISAAGQTLYELAMIGVPTIAIGIADNQAMNIKGWRQAGFIEYAGMWNDAGTLKRTRKLFEKMKSDKLRKEKSEIGRRCIDGKGSLRIAEYLLERL